MQYRILFVVTYLDCGGICRSLQNFLNKYDTSHYEVDVFAMVHTGMYCGQMPNCTILPKNVWLDAIMARYSEQKGLGRLLSLMLKVADKITKGAVKRKIVQSVSNKLLSDKHYDAVVGFSEGAPTLFVAKMHHSNKVAWIHCDYASYMNLNGNRDERQIYDSLSSVVCVSEYTRQSFLGYFPDMASKTYAIYNILDSQMMIDQSQLAQPAPYVEGAFNIVSVGRIDPVKRMSSIPELADRVRSAGCNIHWYIVGPKATEDEYAKLTANIVRYHMEDYVHLLGEQTNPYPYIANADLLVNTSISEACPYVINEAKILRTPIVCTNFGSAKEFVDYGANGYYEPFELIPDRIVSIVNDSAVYASLKANLQRFEYDNAHILAQIAQLVEGPAAK